MASTYSRQVSDHITRTQHTQHIESSNIHPHAGRCSSLRRKQERSDIIIRPPYSQPSPVLVCWAEDKTSFSCEYAPLEFEYHPAAHGAQTEAPGNKEAGPGAMTAGQGVTGGGVCMSVSGYKEG
jgi:hypothetical protein